MSTNHMGEFHELVVEWVVYIGMAIVAFRLLLGDLKINIPTHVKICDIVDEAPAKEVAISVNEEVKPKKKKKSKKNKNKKKKMKKEWKELCDLKEDCALTLVALGVKKSEAPAEVERVFEKNKNIKSVVEFLRSVS